jgi:hypothetical protein
LDTCEHDTIIRVSIIFHAARVQNAQIIGGLGAAR